MERVFYHIVDGLPTEPMCPEFSSLWATLKPAFRAFRKVSHSLTAWSSATFVDSYHGRRRALFERAYDRIKLGYSRAEFKAWTRYRAFIKHEKLAVKAGKRLVPRLIQPRDPCYNVLVGRFLKPAEHAIFRMIQSMFKSSTPVVAKGLNVRQLGNAIRDKWRRHRRPRAIGLDMARFDQHISKSALMFEHRWYYHLYGWSPELKKLLWYQLKNHGSLLVDDGRWTYWKEGGRGSGDMNTSLGNIIIMCSLIYSYCESRHIPIEMIDLVDNGDDATIICDEKYVNAFNGLDAFCAELGFVLTREPVVDTLEHISFCQMQPVCVGDDEWTMVRSWPSAINKDLHTTHHVNTELLHKSYLAGLGVCGLAMGAGVPVFQAFYGLLGRMGTPMSPEDMGEVGMRQWIHGLEARVLPITDDARVSFWKAFGVLPEHQIAMEEGYDSLGPDDVAFEPGEVAHPLERATTDPAGGRGF